MDFWSRQQTVIRIRCSIYQCSLIYWATYSRYTAPPVIKRKSPSIQVDELSDWCFQLLQHKMLISCARNSLPKFDVNAEIVSLITFQEFTKFSMKNKVNSASIWRTKAGFSDLFTLLEFSARIRFQLRTTVSIISLIFRFQLCILACLILKYLTCIVLNLVAIFRYRIANHFTYLI